MLTGAVGPTIARMAAPMVLGIASVVAFNVVDTFFVGQLGANALAAMSFTFPVVFVVMSVAMGLSVATTVVISAAIGRGDDRTVQRLATHALALATGIVGVFCVVGLLTIEPVFRALGAADETVPLVRQYMVPWYIGVGFLVIPMVGNGAIRATGDTKTPSYIMMFAVLTNLVLDPLLIFGVGPFPRLELQGAAIATVIGRSLTFVAALWILYRRERMLWLRLPSLAELWDSWGRILHVGIPATAARILVPLSTGVLTRMVADYGPNAVAAFGVGQRLEALAIIGIGALGAANSPFVGQNYGAGQYDRVRQALRFGFKVSMAWGAAVAAFLAVFAHPLARMFNDEPEVIGAAVQFLWIVPISYGLYGAALLVIETLNAIQRPMHATALVVIRLFALAVPLAWVGSRFWQVSGIFGGIAAGNVLIGLLAFLAAKRLSGRLTVAQAAAD